jgi:hypothetical protein
MWNDMENMEEKWNDIENMEHVITNQTDLRQQLTKIKRKFLLAYVLSILVYI